VVDVGSGQGYLTRVLGLQYGFDTVCPTPQPYTLYPYTI